jgi:NTE family protein
MNDRSKTTAFVLSGGAALGSIQVGMLEALYERGVTPDFIVATSAGALNGAFLATRPQTVETAEELGDIWRSLRRGRIFPVNPVTGMLGFLGTRDHLVPASGLRRLMQQHACVDRLEETSIPLHVIATDVLSGEEVRLSHGPLVDAIMASAAIPGVFPPVEWDGRQLIDGGVSNNVPLSHALELGARRIYVLPTGAPCELKAPPRGALPMLLYATSLLVGHRLQADLAGVSAAIEVVVMPPPCPLPVQPTDFSHAGDLISQARRDARRYLQARDRPAGPTRRPRVARTRSAGRRHSVHT